MKVVNNAELSRYEIYVDDVLAGFAEYRLREGRAVFTHTEIDEAFEGRGLGSKLAGGALDDVRLRELPVVPLCPFIVRYIRRHPEYRDLVADDYRDQVS